MRILQLFLKAENHDNAGERDEQEWRNDPFLHPDVAKMSQRELADLPFYVCQSSFIADAGIPSTPTRGR